MTQIPAIVLNEAVNPPCPFRLEEHLISCSSPVLRWRDREAAQEGAEQGQGETLHKGCETQHIAVELSLSALGLARKLTRDLQNSGLRALRKITEQMATAQPEGCTVLY